MAQRRERDALRAARPSYYARRRGLGFAAIGVGGAAAFTGVSFLLLETVSSMGPHSGPDSGLSPRERRAIGFSLGLGLPILGVGIWAVRSPVLATRNMRVSVVPALRWRTGALLGFVAKVTL